jgi:hypothetical protein
MRYRLFKPAEGGHLKEEQVALFVDALLLSRTPELPPPLLDHVEECLPCKQRITDTYRLVRSARLDAHGPHPVLDHAAEKKVERRVVWLRAAAALAAVAGVGLLAAYLSTWNGERREESTVRSDPPSESPVRTPGREQPVTPDKGLLAAAYTENAELESLAADPTRSGTAVIVSPPPGALVPSRVVFEWRTDSAPPFTIVVMDNRGGTVHTATVGEQRFTASRAFPPGLYYWKVVGSEELLLAGKFTTR